MKTNLSSVYTCSLCKKEVQFENMKYSNDGKRIVCLDCFTKTKKIEQQKEKEVEIAKTGKAGKSDVLKLFCAKCGYRFGYKKSSRANLMCPYCGGDNLMDDETTAEMLVKNISKADY